MVFRFRNVTKKLSFHDFSENYFARGIVYVFLAENFKESHFEVFVEKVARGNAVQIFPNFPAKRLSIYRDDFFFTPF